MNTTTVIVSLGFTAIGTAVASKIAGTLGQGDIAEYIKVAGVSGSGLVAIGLAIQLLLKIKGF